MKKHLHLEPVMGTVYQIRSDQNPARLPAPADQDTLRKILTADPAHFEAREQLADLLFRDRQFDEACQLHYEGALLVADLFEEEDPETTADWDDAFTALALTTVYTSAMDHFMIGDFEMAAALFELALDRDPEDHLGASEWLAFSYVALEEWELLEELLEALPGDALSKQLIGYWTAYRQGQTTNIKANMQKESPALYREWTAQNHDETPAYQADLESKRPRPETQARQLWLRTQTLWEQFPDFIEALK